MSNERFDRRGKFSVIPEAVKGPTILRRYKAVPKPTLGKYHIDPVERQRALEKGIFLLIDPNNGRIIKRPIRLGRYAKKR